MNGMLLGAYEQAWRRGGSPARHDEFPPELARAVGRRSSVRRNAGSMIGFAAMAIALFFAGASYA
jgi:hypothetical protein